MICESDGWVMWFRADRHGRWEAVGSAPTEAEASDMVGIGGRHHGQWMVLRRGETP
jgi:hypothetical protein